MDDPAYRCLGTVRRGAVYGRHVEVDDRSGTDDDTGAAETATARPSRTLWIGGRSSRTRDPRNARCRVLRPRPARHPIGVGPAPDDLLKVAQRARYGRPYRRANEQDQQKPGLGPASRTFTPGTLFM